MFSTRIQHVDVGDARLFVESGGQGSAVVLIHSGITDLRMWDHQFSVIARHHQSIRYDLRGFGRSFAPTSEYSHIEDLHMLLDALEIERAQIVAASMGAAIAIDFALAYSERVRSLYLVGPAISGARLQSDALQKTWRAMQTAEEAGDIEEMIELELRVWVDGPTRWPGNAARSVREQVRQMQRAIYANPLDEDLEVGPDRLAIDHLSELRVPTMVIVGEHDVDDIHRNARLIVDQATGATHTLIRDAGHLPNMEHPAVVNRQILDFLASVESPG